MDSASTECSSLPNKRKSSSVENLGDDVLSMIFAFLDLIHFVRCSGVCKSWCSVVNKMKYKRVQNLTQLHNNEDITQQDTLINYQLEHLAMKQHRSCLHNGHAKVCQWKGHSAGVNKCKMKAGLILTGVGDKVMHLWSAESCKRLDSYYLPDKAPLLDFDFDESKVVGLVGTRICIWKRTGTRDLFSSHDGLFTRGLCMSFADPQAVVGCVDGKVRVFDMYSRKVSLIVKMHPYSVSCLELTDEQLLISGSSNGTISLSDLSTDQMVSTVDTGDSAGIKTLCYSPRSHLLFTGSNSGFASCWDLRKLCRVWINRISPNMLNSMQHLRNDESCLAVGGIDGVLRIIDQETGEVLSRWIMERKNGTKDFERKKAVKLSEDERIDLIPSRPPITCLGVGMQKIVSVHGDRYLRLWKFRNK